MNTHSLKCKWSSGRLILTVTAAIAFLIIVWTLCEILREKAIEIEVVQIILLITNFGLIIQNTFNSYFNKKRPAIDDGSDDGK